MKTPNLARMASQGIRAVMGYSPSAICAPSRASIFLERHVGVVDCIRGNAVSEVNEMLPIPGTLQFVSELQRAGYRTGYFGKWGLGVIQGGPWNHGFDTYAGQLYHIEAHTYFPDSYHQFNLGDVAPRIVSDLDQFKVTIPANVDSNRQSWQAFFTFIAPTYPHAGKYNSNDKNAIRIAPAKWISPDRINQKPLVMRGHASQIEQSMDMHVGQVLDYLESNSTLNTNTLFIFTSDNGANMEPPFHKSIYSPTNGLRGAKRNLYEGGIRIPVILRWPSVFPASTVSATPFVLYDLGPTIREIARLPSAPTNTSTGKPTLSVSMYNVWRTLNDTTLNRPFMQFEMCGLPGKDLQCKMAILDLRTWQAKGKLFKLQQFPGQGKRKELFDLRTNPKESSQIKNNKQVVSELNKIKDQNRSPFNNVCVLAPQV
ncbi:hypothetical protein BASA81_010565 [Batrachochytrium salamandrivorans]|nr:hypothetical protein BASA81_010565 [Batrachochytrium salamandrivorans]